MPKKSNNPEKKITLTMLAKDVLKWLKPGSKIRIVPKFAHGYVGSYGDAGDVQKHVKAGKPCAVCGIGALAVAAAVRIDSLKFNDFDPMNELLREACVDLIGLTNEQAGNIEGAFELGGGLANPARSAKGRLKQICENILKNKGEFVKVK